MKSEIKLSDGTYNKAMQNDIMIYNCIAANHNYKILKSALDTVNEFLKDGHKIYLCGNKTITLDEPFDDFYEWKIID